MRPAVRPEVNERALEHLFAGLEWDVVTGHGQTLAPEEPLDLPTAETVLVTPLVGAVEIAQAGPSCTVVGAGLAVRPSTRVDPGGVLLSLGRERVTVRAPQGADIRLTRLVPTAATAPRLDVIPRLLSVTDLAASEPGAAALAPYVGHPVTEQAGTTHTCTAAPVLCRLMATTLVLAVLRAWAVAGCAPAGWPARTADPHLSRAIDAIHAEPGRPWTVESLAALAAMSRSSFAERFRVETGASPLGYLAEVRMASARSLLADGALVTETARRLGYASDEGFSRAFRRHHDGVAPSRWRAAMGSGVG